MDADMNCDIAHPKTIVHIDIDCFYAQVEMVLNPSLCDKPIGIKQKNLLVTSNYKAREMGLRKCMYVKQALIDLPSLIIIDGSDLTNYRNYSSDVNEVLHRYTNLVEKLGFDENFIDISDIIEEDSNFELTGKVFGFQISDAFRIRDLCGCGCFNRIKAGAILARKIRENILQATGLTCCAGIAHNKLLAKLVCSKNKPNDQTIVFPWQSKDILVSLNSAREIPGIGIATFKVLNNLGIYSVSDLQNSSLTTLLPHFSRKVSELLFSHANGVDSSVVRSSGPPSTLGVEESFIKVASVVEVRDKFLQLTRRLLSLLEKDDRNPSCIKVTIRKFSNKQQNTRESKQAPLNSTFMKLSDVEKIEYVSNQAFNIFKKMIYVTEPFQLTLLGISFAKLEKTFTTDGLMADFFKRRKSETKTVNHNLNDEIPANSNSQTNNISLKEVCYKLKNGIKIEEISNSTDKDMCMTTNLPIDIDRSVFYSLPVDIQNEILNNYSNKRTDDEVKLFKQTTRLPTVSSSNKSPMKQTKVSDFFKKT